MDDPVFHACRLLRDASCDNLEVRRFIVHVERDRVSITIYPKHGRQESKLVIGEDSPTTENVRQFDEWRCGSSWRGHLIAATLQSYGQGGSSQHSFGDRGDGGDDNRQRRAR